MVVIFGVMVYLLCDWFLCLIVMFVVIGVFISFFGVYISYFLDGVMGGIIVML